MEKEVVDFSHQSAKVAVWLVAHPSKHVVDRLFETLFKLCSKRRGFRDARFETKPKETVDEYPRVPVTTGIVRITHLAVSKTKLLLRVLKERLYPSPRGVAADDVGRRRVNLARRKVINRILFVLVSNFLRNYHPNFTSLRYRQCLRPDLVRFLVDFAFFLVDALFQRISLFA